MEARESFLIRSDQVNAVASATLRLAGPLADPEISGRVTFDGGAVIFRGRRYDITSGWLELSGGYEDPRLQLQAEGNIRDIASSSASAAYQQSRPHTQFGTAPISRRNHLADYDGQRRVWRVQRARPGARRVDYGRGAALRRVHFKTLGARPSGFLD